MSKRIKIADLLKKYAIQSGVASVCLVMAMGVSTTFISKQANACGDCYSAVSSADPDIWQESQDNFDRYLDREFKQVESFVIEEMWEQSILPAMMLAAEQFTAVAMQQAMAIGMFIDAQVQLETQRLLQEIQAKVHKRYHPSEGVCEFGSVVKSIAATEMWAEPTMTILRRRSLNRQLGHADTSATYGNDLDQYMRLVQLRDVFCNEKSRVGPKGSVLNMVCEPLVWTGGSMDQNKRERIDMDIDYYALVDNARNMKIDFITNNKIEDTGTPAIDNRDEEHLMALNANLFGFTTFPRPPALLLKSRSNKKVTTMQKYYLDLRSIIAKRGVGENSLYAIAAMKTPGNTLAPTSGSTREPMNARVYMEHILRDLGVPDTEILNVLGENPSYYAQMEILTKRIYQDPNFYTNLYDKPANVERKAVALQAIKLMQKFDMLKSFLRGEMTISMLLELAVVNFQQEVEDQIIAIGASD